MENTLQYKGYFTHINYSAEDMVLHGKIEGIDDLVTFESEQASEIEKEFHAAVDDYLEYCKELGKEPAKTYKGTFNIRIEPELHKAIAQEAMKKGISLNQAVEKAIDQFVFGKNDFAKANMASIDSKLSEISGALVHFSVAWQINQLEPNYTYVTTVISNVTSVEGVES